MENKNKKVESLPRSEGKNETPYYRQKDEEAFFWAIKIGLYLILLTPFLVNSNVLFPFVSFKTAYFRILTEIIFAVYLLLALRFPKYRPRWSYLFLSICLFMGVAVLTSLIGVNVNRSMWSTYERMGGLFTYLHLWAFFIVLTGVFREKKEWKGFLTASVIIAAIVSIYAFLAPGSHRGGGTIGNTSFLAAYLIINIFLAGMFFVKEKGAWKIMYGIPLLAILAKFLTTGTKAAILSFFAGLVALFVLYGLRFFGRKSRTYALLFIVCLIIVSVLLGLLFGGIIKNAVDGALSLPTIKARSLLWNMALSGWKEKFFLGWGPENFNAVFNKYFDSRLAYAEYGGEIWFDKSHNIIFDVAVDSGIAGLGSYLLIFVVALFILWKKDFLFKNNFTVAAFVSVALMTYFAQNLSVFDMIGSYFMFFLILAYVDFCGRPDNQDDFAPRTLGKMKIHPILIGFFSALLFFVMFKGNIQPLLASGSIDEIFGSSRQKSVDQALIAYEKRVKNIWWGKPEIRENLIKITVQYAKDLSGSHVSDELRRVLLFAAAEGEEAIKDEPLNVRAYLFLGDVYNILSKADEKYILSGEKILMESIRLSPGNAQIYQQLGQNRLNAGDYERAISYYSYAADLTPRLDKSHWFLSYAYKIAGNPEMGLQSVRKAVELGYSDETAEFSIHIGDLYLRAGRIGDAIGVYEKALKKYPADILLRVGLAVAYKNAGYIDEAAAEAEKISELNSGFATSSREFIESLRGGD